MLATEHFNVGLETLFIKILAGMMENGSLKKNDPAMLAFAYTALITLLVHLCDREPEKEPEVMAKMEAFIRHVIDRYGGKMKKIFKILLISAVVIMLGLGLAFTLIYGPNFGIYLKKPSPQEYVQQAVKFMDDQGIYSDTDEWKTVREETLKKAADISSYEESYTLLENALKTVGGKHSRLITPDKKEDNSDSSQMPECEMRSDGILVIRLPEFTGDSKAGAEYAKTANDAIRQYANDTKGVIVDLRGNTGGDMGPMVAAVSPLLEDGVLMNFGVKGTRLPVTLKDGCVAGGGSTVKLEEPFKLTGIPVAILQDDMTASSGEATLICFRGLDYVETFGTATAGYCSSNNVIKLYDGAAMLLTMGTDIARTEEEFCEDPIEPDEQSAEPEAAAAEWILGYGNQW